MLFSPQLLAAPGRLRAFRFVGADVVEAGSGTISWPSGTSTGDQAIIAVFGSDASPSVSGTGWTEVITNATVHPGARWSVYTKASLSSSDISLPPTFSSTSNGGYAVYICRGGAAIALKSSLSDDSGTTADLTGFVKNASSLRIVTIVCERADGDSDISAPTGFTERWEEKVTFFDLDWADIAPAGYTDNATVTWGNLGGAYDQAAALFELT